MRQTMKQVTLELRSNTGRLDNACIAQLLHSVVLLMIVTNTLPALARASLAPPTTFALSATTVFATVTSTV